MTTFTRIPEDETPSISVNVSRRLSKIDPNIYGGFMEHMGRCIYGGIYDPTSPLSDTNGFRTDVLAALRELDIPNIRYPGGNFVATYHWQDGIGPPSLRPTRPELAWLGTETNEFGTHEFLKFLDVLGTKSKKVEPYFCLNFGTGTLDEALAWVEYCNGTKNTYWANLRRKNGREEPWGIRYWALGNEMWGNWQVGQMTKENYAETALQWAKALKLLDPSLLLVLCGETGHSEWDYHVLKHCIHYISYHSIHIYTSSTTHLPNTTAPLSAESAITIASSLIDLAIINAYPPIPANTIKPRICFDEWNVWDPLRAPGEEGAEEMYTLSDALAVGVWLNVFIRQSKYVGMANIAQSVNVISPLMTTKEGVVRQTTWWPLYLFSKYMRGWTLGVHVRGGVWDCRGKTKPKWLGTILSDGASWLDVSACISREGIVSLAVVNISEMEDIEVDLLGVTGSVGASEGAGERQVQVFTVTGTSVTVTNKSEKTEVGVNETMWDGKGKFTFGKHSLTLLRWETGAEVKEVEVEGMVMLDTRKLAWTAEEEPVV